LSSLLLLRSRSKRKLATRGNGDTLLLAEENNQLECLKYAKENGCPLSKILPFEDTF
jgi:hypothetical protein